MKKTIILTGATGVVGRSLKGFLRKKKLNLVLLDRSKLKNSKEILNRKLNPNKKNFLIHLAGKDDHNSNSSSQMTKTNSKLDKQIIKITKKFKISLIIFSSSNRVYEGLNSKTLSEKSRTIPATEYGISKLKSEQKFQKLNSKLVILRLPSVLSKFSKKGLIYFIFKKMVKNKDIKIFNPLSLYNNVILQSDFNKAVYYLINTNKTLPKKKIINLNSEKPIRFIDLINFMLKKIRSNSRIFINNNSIISKVYSNKTQRKLFDFKIKSVKYSINSYLNDL